MALKKKNNKQPKIQIPRKYLIMGDLTLLSVFSVVSILIVVCLVKLYLLPNSKLQKSPLLQKPKFLITILSIQIPLASLMLYNMQRRFFGWLYIIGVIVHITLSVLVLYWVLHCNKKRSQKDEQDWCLKNANPLILPLIFTNISFVFIVMFDEMVFSLQNLKAHLKN